MTTPRKNIRSEKIFGDYLDFNSGATDPSAVAGRQYFDASENAMSYYPNTPNMDVTINVGQEGVIPVYNDTGSAILNGQACYITGGHEVDGVVTIALAVASAITATTDRRSLISGIATHDIANGAHGLITLYGKVRDLTVTGQTPGTDIYLSDTTAGGFIYDINNLDDSSRVSRIGHVITTGVTASTIQVEIINEHVLTLLSARQSNKLSLNNASSGIVSGGTLSVDSATGGTFNVSGGKGYLADNSDPLDPTFTVVTWSDFTGQTATYFTASTHSFISINTSGSIIQRTGSDSLTPQEKREEIQLGGLLHIGSYMYYAWDRPIAIINPINQLEDLTTSIGPFAVYGNTISGSTTDLSLYKTAGESFYFGGNYISNHQTPNNIITSALSSTTLVYANGQAVMGPSGTTIDVANYDPSGAGTITALANNKFSAHRIWHQPTENVIVFQYGQVEYDNLEAARAEYPSESFVVPNLLLHECYVVAIAITKQNVTDFSNGDFVIIPQGKFAGTGGAGSTPDTLQSAYNNSSQPEILTSASKGAVDFRNGSTATTDNVITVQESGGTITGYWQGDGALSANTMSAQSVSIYSSALSGQTMFDVVGSSGQLFSITDSLEGVLFSVNDISGLPILEVNSDSTTTIGNFVAPSLYTTAKATVTSGTQQTIYSVATSAYTSAFLDYTVASTGVGARTGSLNVIWSGDSNIDYNEVTTPDIIGSTADVVFYAEITGSTALFRASATTNNWTVKTIVKSI